VNVKEHLVDGEVVGLADVELHAVQPRAPRDDEAGRMGASP
jgi:hypothetical protein